MGSAVQLAQGPEVQRFEIEGSGREGLDMSFEDGTYIQVTPDAEGPGCDIAWTTDKSGLFTIKNTMDATRLAILDGSLSLKSQDSASATAYKSGKAVVDALGTAKYDDLQEVWLIAPPVRAHWRKHILPKRGSQGFYNLMHLWVGGPFTRQADGLSVPADRRISETLDTRGAILTCIAKTATASVCAHSERIIDRAALNIPLLRRT